MTGKYSGEVRRVASELRNIADKMDHSPVPKNAPVLYEEMCIKIYGTPEVMGGANLYVEHTCRNDLGVVMIQDRSPLFDAILSCIGGEDGDSFDREAVKEWAEDRDDVSVELY